VLQTAPSPVQQTLTRATVEELARLRGEPDWLRELRLAAFAAYQAAPLPTQQTEGWRRTSLRGLRLDGHTVLSPPPTEVGGAQPPARVLDLAEASRDPALAERLRAHLGRLVPVDFDTFTALHYAFMNQGVVVHVPRGAVLDEPIWLTHAVDEPGLAAFSHTLLFVDDEADVAVVDEYVSAERGGAPLASVVVEQVLGRNAQVRYVHLQRWATELWSFSAQRARLAADAHLRTLNVALGARMARNTVQVVLDGKAAQADLLGVAALDGRQHVDFQTLQDHYGDATRSDLFIHDALRGQSSANFTGLIRINKSAHQTESAQEQKNILLSDRARADSDPKLEILNNDVVRCTHGAAVGPVDEEMVFYLESRGLTRPDAEKLIVEGFFRSVLEKLKRPALEAAVWAATERQLAAAPAPVGA
jgi:Fe-S cluster assembly protein SufD